MAHLDSVIIHNFKSFKHVNIKFSKGFNCIVGANGSGKSNICDSLLFALGESSLKRMRVPNTAQLINSFAKPKSEDGVKKAYVKINFDGTDPLEVSRIIKSNNKIGYRLNGKHVTRQEVIEALRSQRSDINETNIIAQNEISYMINLNPKDRRELIDIAAGIKEFNDKKDTAMRELEKVQLKMNEAQIALNERKGFLDQLAREKEDAEKYLALSDTVKRISYTLLKNSEGKAEKDFNSISDALKGLEEKKKMVAVSTTEIDLMLEKLSKDKSVLSKELADKSVELGSTNKILENINRDTAVKETQLKSLKDKIDELNSQAQQLKAEQKKLKEEGAEGLKQSGSTSRELEEKANSLNAMEALAQEGSGSLQLSRLNQNQKQIAELYAQSESISAQYVRYKYDIDSIEKELKSGEGSLSSRTEEMDDILKRIGGHRKVLADAEESIKSLADEVKALQLESQKYRKNLDSIYTENVELRERLSSVGGSSDKVNDFLKRNIDKGFHGRAYELCTYDDKYSLAVNAAAMSRLSYLVVDSAEVADKAIKLLKGKQLGRASFIPLKDLAARYKEDNNELDRLITHVEFDSKFERAFNYIFAGTYVVGSIAEAKKVGFGKGRFVTLEGELVEQSGIITGGSTRQLQSPMMLESKLKALENQKFAVTSATEAIETEITAKQKGIAKLQVEAMTSGVELKHLEPQSQSLKAEIEGSGSKTKELNSRLAQLNKTYAESESKRDEILKGINALKEENEKIYALSDAAKHKTKVDKSEIEKLKSLRSEVESLRIKIATMSKEQEMKAARLAEVDGQIKAKDEEGRDAKKSLAILDAELQELSKNMKGVKETIGKSDASTQSLYKKLQELDTKLSKLGNDKGKYQLELERSSRDLIEQETRKVQLQTRIMDIKAELLGYQNVELVSGSTQEEMEAKRAIAKNDLERLGAVNLKAPEVYEQKKRDVDEVKSRMDTLGTENDSIIAMINEIESKKLNIFNDTLNEVNVNFQRLYGYIFEGSASLQLEDIKDPFNSGLAINIKSPKNKNGTVESLSGGEKSLVIIMLVFAIQAHDPMSLYVFDEIDASLDKENSKKLSKLMKEMSRKSQLIVISHNDSLITAADTAIGVVHRNGESRVVGLQLTPKGIEAK